MRRWSMDRNSLYKIEHELITKGLEGVEDHRKRDFYHYVNGITDAVDAIIDAMEPVGRKDLEKPDTDPPTKKGRKPKVDLEELERMWNQGVRTKELAEHFGVHIKTINKYVTMLRAEEDRIME